MARNYSSISEVKTLAENVPQTGTNSDKVTLLPNLTGLPSVPFVLVLNPDTSNEEAVLATSLSGSTYTVTRNIEGGGLKTHTANQTVRHMIVGSDLQIVHDHFSATTGVHGLGVGVSPAPIASPTFTGTVVLPSATSIGTVSSTEIGYVDGVTSSIQTQINTKAPLASPTFTGTVTLPTGTVTSTMIVDGTIVDADINATAAIDWTKLAVSSTVSATEIGYVDGVTSAIQGQLNLKAPLNPSTNVQTGTAYTLVLADNGNYVEMNNAAANVLTVPANATVAYPVGAQITIIQTGAGTTTITPTAGVTVNYYSLTGAATRTIKAQWAAATLIKRNTDTWVLIGNLG
jgi:hypothetical protein